jgi:hypothetical protein
MGDKVIESNTLGDRWARRFVVVDVDTGKILADAQGYGYKSAQKAHASYAYKTRDTSKDKENTEKRKLPFLLVFCVFTSKKGNEITNRKP